MTRVGPAAACSCSVSPAPPSLACGGGPRCRTAGPGRLFTSISRDRPAPAVLRFRSAPGPLIPHPRTGAAEGVAGVLAHIRAVLAVRAADLPVPVPDPVQALQTADVRAAETAPTAPTPGSTSTTPARTGPATCPPRPAIPARSRSAKTSSAPKPSAAWPPTPCT
jgi:hypothetical protein